MKKQLQVWAILGVSVVVAVLLQSPPFAWAIGVFAGMALPMLYLPERDAKRDAENAMKKGGP